MKGIKRDKEEFGNESEGVRGGESGEGQSISEF
jgi:hypothetical protein